MKRRILLLATLVIALLLLLTAGLSQARQPRSVESDFGTTASTALGTSFTYQGQLVYNDAPVNDTCDFTFSLWDELGSGEPPAGGNQISSDVTLTGVSVSDGLFTVSLDFGTGAFTGEARWLEIDVDCSSVSTTLSPRQPLTRAPYALHSNDADKVDGRHAFEIGDWLHRASPPQTNTSGIVDDLGRDSSVTIGADGLGLIAYYNLANLNVAHCEDINCSSTSITTLDSGDDVGRYPSVAIGADGLGLISYLDATDFDLKVAHCNDVTCSSASTYTLDSDGTTGLYTSVTIGADGLGLISYYSESPDFDLKMAHCDNTVCSSATIYTLDSDYSVGEYTSVAIGADGLGLISYRHDSWGHLKVAHCNNVACSSASTYTLDDWGDAGYNTSVTIGTDGLGLISYYNDGDGTLRVAHCDNSACSSASIAELDTTGYVIAYTSVTIGADSLGLISYSDAGDLKVAHCADVTCTTTNIATLDNGEDVGRYNAVTIGVDGMGLISYYDHLPNVDVKVAHCANTFCTPYFRRR